MSKAIKHLRKDYKIASLAESDVSSNPMRQFELWFSQIKKLNVIEPNAMAVATSSKRGVPSVRMVLLKEYSKDGFIFYSNYDSHKGRDLDSNARASLLFFWPELERQVRIEGRVKKVSKLKSDRYFASRPIGAQVSAAVSPQSSVVQRADLESAWEKNLEVAKTSKLLRPVNWGGYIVMPEYFEFWQGRESRLHDRIVYNKVGKDGWKISRLAP